MNNTGIKKEFIDTILSFKSNDIWSVYSDFFAIAAQEIRYHLSFLTKEDTSKQKEYIEQIYKKYQDEEKELFPKIYALFELLIEQNIKNNKFVDVAGEVFHEIAANSKYTGQFFTPQYVADLTADISINEKQIKEIIAKKGYISFNEPASGAGAMILAYATAIKKYGYNPQKVMFIQATDIDVRCVNMCYLQLALYGLSAVVIHGDTLTNAVWDKLQTPMYIVNLGRFKK